MNSRHFFVWPSARVDYAIACAKRWTAHGYETCCALDLPCMKGMPRDPNSIFTAIKWLDVWRGYYAEINDIVAFAFRCGADVVTVGGDDQDPPPQGAEAVTEIYFNRFPDGFGVLQGCGDKQGDLMAIPGYEHLGKVPNAARICGSPTFGRGWFERSPYGEGKPFHAGYASFYSDEDLWNVAMRAGVLWLNPEVTIFHRHWSWHSGKQPYHDAAQKNWEADQKFFFERKAAGFPAL